MFRFPALALAFMGQAQARLKTRASAALAIAVAASVLSLLSLAPASAFASGPTSLGVSGWQVYSDLNIYPNQDYSAIADQIHGDPGEYATAPAIPAQNDSGWANCGASSPWRYSPYGSGPLCPDASTIGMQVGSILPGCWYNLNFTYFQALVSIPAGTSISQFSVNMNGADDGARVSLVNSRYPGGVTPSNGYIYALTGQSTGDLSPYVVAGEVNRVVITQVDDCATGNNLHSAQISLNGTVIPPAPADTTPPTITLSPASGQTVASSGWYNAASSGTAGLTVKASATDDATAVTNVTCTDGGAQVLNMASAAGSFVLPDGVHHVACTATDGAGNTGVGPGSTAMPVTYQVDQSAPTIAADPSQDVCSQPGSNGWCRGTENAAFTASDPTPGSGLADPSQARFTESSTQNGAGVSIASGQVCDVAGNCNAGITAGPYKIDSVPPTQPTIRFTADGTNGWFKTSPATGTVSATDATSGVAGYACTDSLNGLTLGANGALSVAGDGVHQISCTATDEAGNSSAAGTATVSIDTTPPTITAQVDRAADSYGWYNAPVTVSFTCGDALSGVATCPAPVTLSNEGANQSVSGTAADKAGNSASVTLSSINIDLTPPTVSYSGNALTYTVDQAVNITCAAADNLSGVASTTCADITGPAYKFQLGPNTFSASATDEAGNTGTGSTTFTVQVTNASLCNLTKQFVSNGGIANSLCVKLDNAAKQAAAGNTTASDNVLGAYINEVAAQSGKALTAAQADILTRLAKALQQ